MKLKNSIYDVIKWVVIIVLPAIAVLVGELGSIYGWEFVDVAVRTINSVTVFLGAVTAVSNNQFRKENHVITTPKRH